MDNTIKTFINENLELCIDPKENYPNYLFGSKLITDIYENEGADGIINKGFRVDEHFFVYWFHPNNFELYWKADYMDKTNCCFITDEDFKKLDDTFDWSIKVITVGEFIQEESERTGQTMHDVQEHYQNQGLEVG